MKVAPSRKRFPPELHSRLKHYVYVYLDSKTGNPFYVGRGKGNRAFSHLTDPSESKKCQKISKILASGREPLIDLLCYGLTDRQAGLVEAAAIDLIGRPPLLNSIAGDSTMGNQRISTKEFIRFGSAKPITVREKAILIRINRLYRSGMPKPELYDSTRGIWRLGLRRYKAKYAFAVYQGVVLEVYKIDRWLPSGFSKYLSRTQPKPAQGRWEFEGAVDRVLSRKYVGRSVRKYFPRFSQSPTVYVHC